jgi:hypothetical protein
MEIKLEPEFQKADNLLMVVISGKPGEMITRLEKICTDIKRRGIRPGTEHYIGGITTQIITPVWNGKKY